MLGFRLLFKNALVNNNLTLKDAGIEKNANLQVIYEQVEQRKKAPKSELPKPPKVGYVTMPSFEQFSEMTLEELKNVNNFTIMN